MCNLLEIYCHAHEFECRTVRPFLSDCSCAPPFPTRPSRRSSSQSKRKPSLETLNHFRNKTTPNI